MRNKRAADPRLCSIEAAVGVIGEKWSLLALREIAFGVKRFDDMVFNTGAPRDVLSARLKSLEAAGVIRRRLYQERPERYEYHLDEAGKHLVPILYAISDWGDRFVRSDPENIATFHHSCGSRLTPTIKCAACGEALSGEDVTSDRSFRKSDVADGTPL